MRIRKYNNPFTPNLELPSHHFCFYHYMVHSSLFPCTFLKKYYLSSSSFISTCGGKLNLDLFWVMAYAPHSHDEEQWSFNITGVWWQRMKIWAYKQLTEVTLPNGRLPKCSRLVCYQLKMTSATIPHQRRWRKLFPALHRIYWLNQG